MTAETTQDAWFSKVMLLLVGPDQPFISGADVMSSVSWDLMNKCWDAKMDQYEAASYYRYYLENGHEDSLTPSEWLVDRFEKMPPSVCEEKEVGDREYCGMFYGFGKYRKNRTIGSLFSSPIWMAFFMGIGFGVLVVKFWMK